jgi:hypothetical protein
MMIECELHNRSMVADGVLADHTRLIMMPH